MCEQFRLQVMALADGELDEQESPPVRRHLMACAGCRREMLSWQALNALSPITPEPAPEDDRVWKLYYTGVSRRLERGGKWFMWILCAGLLISSGFLIGAGCPDGILSTVTAGSSIAAGCGVMWTGYFCQRLSSRRRR